MLVGAWWRLRRLRWICEFFDLFAISGHFDLGGHVWHADGYHYDGRGYFMILLAKAVLLVLPSRCMMWTMIVEKSKANII